MTPGRYERRPDWTEAAEDTLRQLWGEGLSASVIGGQLKVSRNAVLGKVHRMKLPTHGANAPRAAKVKPVKDRRFTGDSAMVQRMRKTYSPQQVPVSLPADIKVLKSDAWTPLPGSTPVPLLENRGCWWPVSDGSPHLFCAMPKAPGDQRYCPAHVRLSVHA